MTALRSPVIQFLLLGLLTVSGIAVGSDFLAGQAASAEAIAEASSLTGVLARSVAAPDIPPDLVTANRGAVDRFNRTVFERLLVDDPLVLRVNIYTAEGRLIYTADARRAYTNADRIGLIGQTYPLDAGQRDIVLNGGTGSKIADPDRDQTEITAGTEGLVQIYTQIQLTGDQTVLGDQTLLFEAYYSLDQLEERRHQIFSAFRWITLGPLLLLIVLATIMLRVLTGQLTSAATDRERLLHSAINASDAERRRIARDLHDGVVQDLAGTAFSISAMARDRDTSAQSRTILEGAGATLRDSLTALRSLLAEIHPPDFHADGLAAALNDLTAPARTAGIAASVSIEGATNASDAMAKLVWRGAQELVRNTIRHSQASTLAVTVRGDAEFISLEVVDDGVGFDPEQIRDLDRYGLRGLHSLVTDVGGSLEVVSAPGEGTTVRMRVEAQ